MVDGGAPGARRVGLPHSPLPARRLYGRQSSGRNDRQAQSQAIRRSCSQTAKSTGSSAAIARSRRCAPRRWRCLRPLSRDSLRITPSPDDVGVGDDVVTVYNPCLSGGTLEIFLEPAVPLPVVAVFGHAPIATALLRAHRLFGQQVLQLEKPDDPLPPGARALVVASHGNDEQPVLEAALRAEVPYIALVASRRRGPAVLDSLDVDEQMRSRVRTPAGIDIGARTAPEVALSILAEIVAVLREPPVARDDSPGPAYETGEMVRDPVCGMMVAPVDASPHVETPNDVVYFCGTGCRNAYLDNPLAYSQ